MGVPRIVLDTSVFYAALRSRRGASFRVLELAGSGAYELALSVPLVLEYEHVASRLLADSPLAARDVELAIDYLCSIAHRQPIYFAWRPALPDPHDDFILELAVAASCRYVVTFNLRDFRGIERFGVTAVTPSEFLATLRGDP